MGREGEMGTVPDIVLSIRQQAVVIASFFHG